MTADTDWLDPAWQARAHAWIRERQAALGRPVTGPIEQVQVRPWAAVFRVVTDAGCTWFKANGPGSAYEMPLAAALAGWVPDAVHPPLAVDAGRGWMLTPDGGPTLREASAGTRDLARWEAMLSAYAQLQRDLVSRSADMVALGVPDLRPAALPDRLAGLLDEPDVQVGLGPEGYAAARGLVGDFRDWCAELAADGVPLTLQHDDLHDANVFGVGDGFRFFDWGDASVAHPFGSLLVALYVATNAFELPQRGPELARLRDAYLEPWTADHDRAGLRRSATLAMRVAKVGRSLAWRRALTGARLPVSPDHAGAVVGWLAELTEPDVVAA